MKISVIVPVYNSGKYLPRCIDSILLQTFTDFELILIDDGSTDGSGVLCDEYAKRDGRITVLHQDNKGQSSARNKGLDFVFEHSRSEWIAFVDSDDWICENYLEVLLYSAECCNCEISACDYCEVNSESDAIPPHIRDEKSISPEDFYCEKPILSNVPFAKLYSSHLWRDMRFPEGIIHEDEFVIYRILFTQTVISYTDAPLYRYFINPESTVRAAWTPARLSGLKGKEEQIQYMKERGLQKGYKQAILGYARVAACQIGDIPDGSVYSGDKRKLRRLLRRHIRKYRKTGVFGLKANYSIYIAASPVIDALLPLLKTVRNKINALRLIRYKPRVMNSRETVDYILKNECSVARFGDGEYAVMSKCYDLNFQRRCDGLSEALYNVIKNPPAGLLVCVPDVFGSLNKFNKNSRKFWYNWRRIDFAKMLHHYQGKRYLFGDTQFSRPYVEYPDDRIAAELFPLIKKIWDKRDVLIVEGEQTRFGVKNDLLDNARSVVRILAPAIDAFSRYNEILAEIKANAEGKLLLLALGPTATVLACELCRQGYRAIDIGHLDIEYEWYLAGADKKIAIPGKYTNEVDDGRVFSECDDHDYKAQIVRVIK